MNLGNLLHDLPPPLLHGFTLSKSTPKSIAYLWIGEMLLYEW